MRALVVALFATFGCAASVQDRLPRGYGDNASTVMPECSTNPVPAIVDVLLAAAGGVAVVVGARAEPSDERTATMLIGGTGALIFGASAVLGFKWAGECREAKRAVAGG